MAHKRHSSNFAVLRAEPNDAQELIDVQNLAFHDDVQKYGECPSYGETMANMLDMICNAIVYKVVMNEKIIGDVIIRKRENGIYYLRTIAVIPQLQNTGLGTKIIKFIEQDNADALCWLLITPGDNRRNCHFYEKIGYRKIAEHIHSQKLTLNEYQKH